MKTNQRTSENRLSRMKAPLFGILAMLLVLAAFNSQYLYAQTMLWLRPGLSTSSSLTASAVSMPVTKDPRIIISKLNVDAPVVYDMKQTDDKAISKALERGVLHFANSVNPGERGNAVFVGHSSNDVWAPGDYKFIFALLDHLEVGDTYSLNYDGTQYVYKVTSKKIVHPTDLSVLNSDGRAISTLITCTPVGTNLNRLVITGEQISPTALRMPQQPPASSTNTSLPGSS